jgi:Las17-binding protein actin regulator
MSHSRLLPLLALAAMAAPHAASAGDVEDAQATIAVFKKADPGLSRFFERSAGWAVFPTVGKGAIGIGAAHGRGGVVFQGGHAVGTCTLTQLTVGLQLGGQAYSEIIFFDGAETLADFEKGSFALAAQVSAVAAAEGASANAKYQQGVAVFTIAKGGLMYEASVGGQKFSFEPFGKKK